MMKEVKPKFMLTRVYDDGREDAPEIAPLSQAIDAQMRSRGFFTAGLTGTAALMLLGCRSTLQTATSEPKAVCNDMFAHSKLIRSLAVSPDGQRLFSASDDRTIKIWSLPEGALIRTLKEHSDSVRSLAVISISDISSSMDLFILL
jgi:WD40 repeat protein